MKMNLFLYLIRKYYPQILLIAIIFLPYDIRVRGLILVVVWVIYCTIQLIKFRVYENKYSHYMERRKRNKDTLDFAINYKK